MSKLEQDLQDVDLPVWALLKNVRFDRSTIIPHRSGGTAKIVDYEWVRTAQTYDELNKLIPTPEQPEPPEDEESFRLFQRRFTDYWGKDDEDPRDYKFDPYYLKFETDYEQWKLFYSDYDAFGATYTLLLITPNDLEATKAKIQDEIYNYDIPNQKDDEDDTQNADINGLLTTLTDKYIKRLYFMHPEDDEQVLIFSTYLERDIERWLDGLDILDELPFLSLMSYTKQKLPQLAIKTAGQQDVPTILELMEGYAEHYYVEKETLPSEKEMTEAINGQPGYTFLLAFYDDQPLGFLGYQPGFVPAKGKVLYIDDLFIIEEYRSRGVGEQLLEEFMKQARQNEDIKAVWCVTAKNNFPAIRFFTDLWPDADQRKDVRFWVDL